MTPELRLEVARAAHRAESFLIAQATDSPVPDTDVVTTHGDLTLTRDDVVLLINAARGYLPAFQSPQAAEGLLRRILTDVVSVERRYSVVSDSEGYRESPVTPEEMDYLEALCKPSTPEPPAASSAAS